MATLEYVDIPAGATRLRGSSSASSRSSKHTQSNSRSDIRLAPVTYTSLPNPSPPASPTTMQRQSSISAGASALLSPSLGLIPQLLLSSAIPGGIGSKEEDDVAAAVAEGSGSQPRQQIDKTEKYTLLSSRDPLSLPIMSNNFKRFVSKVGPIFWLQDRIEEVVLWKKGWKVTASWMAAYVFFCWYPRMVLLLPHLLIAGIILATYPYPDALNGKGEHDPNAATTNAAEGSVPWQANLQAIQNLMGAVSDLISAIEPHAYHLVLSPAHFKDVSIAIPTSHFSSSDSTNDTDKKPGEQPSQTSQPQPHAALPTTTRRVSPYTPHILTLLVVTFPFLAYAIHLPQFPIRTIFIVGGLAPFVANHPWTVKYGPQLLPYLDVAVTEGMRRVEKFYNHARQFTRNPPNQAQAVEEEPKRRKPIAMIIQRAIDDDRLSDQCWNSEMREVELWENERLGSGDPHSSNGSDLTWSKLNLRPGERAGWTRGRDGWSGIGAGGHLRGIGAPSNSAVGASGSHEVQGEVSSNLTFSLAPGWSFVETEDWRKDLVGEWSGVGADSDGWVYTNDAWLGARPAPYTAGGGSVTRRRRWTRRVWYDPKRAEREG